LNSSPKDRVYVTQPSSTGSPTVQFGNGVQGSRPPTGQLNIQARYRVGIGLAGMVAAGQLTQPIDRPQGLQSVSNPVAATGGADPATAADARESAPLPTLTLGRIVTLEDYQNFALAFAGIGMALASWTWFGAKTNGTRGIFLTVAGEGGSAISSNDLVVQNLTRAIQDYGLPNVPVAVASYVPVLFEIAAQVKVDSPAFDATQVIGKVWQSLASAFAFGMLAPGQGVAGSQIIQIAQGVPGVIAVRLTALNRSGASPEGANVLCASGPLPPQGAQILLLDPGSQGGIGVWS
jgi:predicted phage baseplate assembly protein